MVLLHIGSDITVNLDDVVAIMDRQACEHVPITRDYLDWARAEDRMHGAVDAATKTFVITTHGIYPSPISSTTLSRRAAAF